MENEPLYKAQFPLSQNSSGSASERESCKKLITKNPLFKSNLTQFNNAV